MSQTLDDGEDAEVEGSSSTYTLSRKGTVYSCTCPAWRNQSAPIDMRTCKHLRAYLGEDVEVARVGATNNMRAGTVRASGGGSSAKAAKETAPPVLLAHKWEVEHDPTGWWMSEKLDGVRAYWDGEGFLSRQGNKFFAPDWFVEALPADTLDGELWVGRKMFSKTISIVRSGAMGVDWKNVQYVVFDAPNAKGGFEDRIAHAEKVIGAGESEFARVLEHITCDGFGHLREELARVEGLGGEGLMLRRPKSKYEKGRSNTLLKVKTFHDTEGRVIGHAPGAGKHKGRLGALICELPNGTTFNVGTGFTDAEREDPPEIGSVITFRYQELTDDGVPRFPSWVGVRLDAEWPPKSEAKSVTQTKKSAAPAAKPAKPTGSAKPTKARDDDDDAAGDDEDDDAPAPVKKAKPVVASGEVVKKKAVVYTPPPDDDDDDGESSDDSDDDDDVPIVTKKSAGSAKKSAPPPAADEDEDEASDDSDDDDDIPIVASAKKRAPAAAAADDDDEDAAESDEEDEDEDEAPPPRKVAAGSVKKKAPPPPADDEEDEAEEEAEDEDAKPAADFFVSLVHPGENKFWEIEVRGKIHYTRFGKIGSPGQTRLTDVGSLTACKSDADKRAMLKRKEGYVAKKK